MDLPSVAENHWKSMGASCNMTQHENQWDRNGHLIKYLILL
jgi:hypothetical protein